MPAFTDDLLDQASAVLEACRRRGLKIATAESCTGGLVIGVLTEIPGSSDVVDRGFVTYSNAAKIAQLGVASDIIDTFGAVSEACAWAMARGALANSDADLAVAITGVAGPGGGSATKPVGHVVFAVAHKGADENDIAVEVRNFGDLGRSAIRLQAVRVALGLLAPGC
jgi:nicotinamide-nucleotide amidase